jgi:hypothetical protein
LKTRTPGPASTACVTGCHRRFLGTYRFRLPGPIFHSFVLVFTTCKFSRSAFVRLGWESGARVGSAGLFGWFGFLFRRVRRTEEGIRKPKPLPPRLRLPLRLLRLGISTERPYFVWPGPGVPSRAGLHQPAAYSIRKTPNPGIAGTVYPTVANSPPQLPDCQ